MNMLNVCTKEELEANKVEEKESVATPSSSPKHPHMTAERREVVKNKIKAVAKMGTYYKTLQMENDAIMKLKVLSPGGRLAPGTVNKSNTEFKGTQVGSGGEVVTSPPLTRKVAY